MRSRPSPTDENRVGRRIPSFPVFSGAQIGYTTMGRLIHANLALLAVACLANLALTIPTSLVDKIKYNEIRNNKVKRAHPADLLNSEENEDIPYYSQPSAIKRGANMDLKSPLSDQSPDWEKDQSMFSDRDSLPSIPASLYNSPENTFDDKTIADYEKGFRYGSNKDGLDEAVENAVLKSEIYGEPAAINQYRYYGMDDRKRKRRQVKRSRLESRIKRDVDLTPEEVVALLSLYENTIQDQPSESYRHPWNRYEQNLDLDFEQPNAQDKDDEMWYNNPVMPHVSMYEAENPNYMQRLQKLYEKSPKWGDDRNKRFMVSKKKVIDPTRELRYLNGPKKNDFYTLSQLLSHQGEPDMPVHHRLLL